MGAGSDVQEPVGRQVSGGCQGHPAGLELLDIARQGEPKREQMLRLGYGLLQNLHRPRAGAEHGDEFGGRGGVQDAQLLEAPDQLELVGEDSDVPPRPDLLEGAAESSLVDAVNPEDLARAGPLARRRRGVAPELVAKRHVPLGVEDDAALVGQEPVKELGAEPALARPPKADGEDGFADVDLGHQRSSRGMSGFRGARPPRPAGAGGAASGGLSMPTAAGSAARPAPPASACACAFRAAARSWR